MQWNNSYGNEPGQKNLTFQAASYNTFSKVGDLVKVDIPKVAGAGDLPRGARGDADFKRVGKRSRTFAFDELEMVVYANRDHLITIPLEEFNIPDEPFLMATLVGSERFSAGIDSTVTLKVSDPRVKIEVESKPDGMKIVGNQIQWKPTADQLGSTKLLVNLKAGMIERTHTFDLKVVRPSLEMPFAPNDFAISDDGRRALIWEGVALDQFGRPGRGGPAMPSGAYRLAQIDLTNGKVIVEKKLADPVQQAVVLGDTILFLSPNSDRCDIHSGTTLEKVKTILMSAPILGASKLGQQLVFQTQAGVEIFDAASYQRVGSVSGSPISTGPMERFPGRMGIPGPSPGSATLTKEGIVSKGLLVDLALKPILMISPDTFPALPGGDAGSTPAFAPILTKGINPQPFAQPSFGESNGVSRVATLNLARRGATAYLEQRSQFRQVPGSVHTSRQEYELTLNVTGDRPVREALVKEERAQGSERAMSPPKLAANADAVFAAVGRNLYRVALPAGEAAASSDLSLAARQSAFALSGKGTTTLTHSATGGKAPRKFSVLTAFDSITIDESTGDVTLQEKPLLDEAVRAAEQAIVRANRGESYLDTYRQLGVSLIPRCTEVLGRKPVGLPVAIPIRLEVADADSGRATLQYYVVAEIPAAMLTPKLQTLEEQRKSRPMPMLPAEVATEGPRGNQPGGGDPDLKRRVEVLEQRLDLMTRQLNEILKKLDK